MRVRIIRPPSEEPVDGIDVSAFRVGRAYYLPASLATLMIVEGWAEPVIDSVEPTLPAFSFELPVARERRRRVRGEPNLQRAHGIAADRRRRK